MGAAGSPDQACSLHGALESGSGWLVDTGTSCRMGMWSAGKPDGTAAVGTGPEELPASTLSSRNGIGRAAIGPWTSPPSIALAGPASMLYVYDAGAVAVAGVMTNFRRETFASPASASACAAGWI